MKQQHTITSLPPSPEEERRARMIKYTIMMSIRVACIVAMLFVQGWWLLVFAAGAVFLPYFAVVIANTGSGRGGEVERPGAVVWTGRPVRRDDAIGASASPAASSGGANASSEPSASSSADASSDAAASNDPDASGDAPAEGER